MISVHRKKCDAHMEQCMRNIHICRHMHNYFIANNNYYFSLKNNTIIIHVATFYYTIYDLLTTVY